MVPDPSRRLAIVRELAVASGTAGVDLLETMHTVKTGDLLRASVMMGAWSSGELGDTLLNALSRFGTSIGLAFQIQDDILDVEGDTGTLGKVAGADSAREKPTYPSVAGLEQAKRRAQELCDEAITALEALGDDAEPLRALARYIVRRTH